MNKSQTEKFKKILLEQKASVAQELEGIANKNTDHDEDWETRFPNFEQENFDIEGAADEVEEYINRLPLEHVLELKLKATNEALQKIEKGTYGKCENCGETIPEKRLEALPEAKICLKCKEEK